MESFRWNLNDADIQQDSGGSRRSTSQSTNFDLVGRSTVFEESDFFWMKRSKRRMEIN